MATLEITISSSVKGTPIAQETYEISDDLAYEFVARLEALAAELPGRHRTRRAMRADGATVVEFHLNQPALPPPVQPSFETLFRESEKISDVQKKKTPSPASGSPAGPPTKPATARAQTPTGPAQPPPHTLPTADNR